MLCRMCKVRQARILWGFLLAVGLLCLVVGQSVLVLLLRAVYQRRF